MKYPKWMKYAIRIFIVPLVGVCRCLGLSLILKWIFTGYFNTGYPFANIFMVTVVIATVMGVLAEYAKDYADKVNKIIEDINQKVVGFFKSIKNKVIKN